MIIAPYWNVTTGNLQVWVTSDLWDATSGTSTFSWYDWSGNKLDVSLPSSAAVNVGAINSTQVLSADLFSILNGTANSDYSNVIMRMEVEATGTMPNSNVTQTFRHENWFHASPLSIAELVDPGLQITYSNSTQNFTVKATTGVAAWCWIDYPAGAVLNFDSNAFWLLPNETRELSYTVKSDTTNGAWIEGVTVESLWNNTLS